MLKVIFIFMLVNSFCGKSDADGITCPDDFTQFEERCYRYIPTPAQWHDARVTCLLEYGADLISLDEQSFFEHITAEFGGPFFVGATDVVQEGTFVWTNGLLVTGGWLEGEPSNGQGRENCVVFTGSGLNDVLCEDANTFICEKGGCPPGDSLYEGDCIKCPNTYIRFKNKCFKYNPTQVSWYEARQSCREDGGDLVSLNEHAFFDHVATFTRDIYIEVHVGAKDLAEEGVFIWANGEPVIDGWSDGEPNDDDYWDGEDCVSLSPYLGLLDISCSINFGTVAFICERNVTSLSTTTSSTTPVPSSASHSNTTSSGPAVTFSMTNLLNTMIKESTMTNRANLTTKETMPTHSMTNRTNTLTKETLTTNSMTNRTNITTQNTTASMLNRSNITTTAITTTLANLTFITTTYSLLREQFSPSVSTDPSTQRAPENTTATTDGSKTLISVSSTPSTAQNRTHGVDTARSTVTFTPNGSVPFIKATETRMTSSIKTATAGSTAFTTNYENTTATMTTTSMPNTSSRTASIASTSNIVPTTTATAYTTAAAITTTAYTTAATTTATTHTTAATTTATAYTTVATTTATANTTVATTTATAYTTVATTTATANTTVATTTATANTTAATATATANTTVATTTATTNTTAATRTATAYTAAATTTATVFTITSPPILLTDDTDGSDSKLLLGLLLSAAVLHIILVALSVWTILKLLKINSRLSEA